MTPLTYFTQIIGDGICDIADPVEPVQAKVVRAALEQGRFDRPANGLANERQVTVIKLVLQHSIGASMLFLTFRLGKRLKD